MVDALPDSAGAVTTLGQSGAIEVFFSYAREDEALRDELAKHLSTLQREGVITAWHDREIIAGGELDRELDQHLNTAQIILLLASADFFASDDLYNIQLKRALERHQAGEARVIPVLLRPVDWENTPLGKLQPLPRNGEPITRWTNQDQAFLEVAQGIRRAVLWKALRARSGEQTALLCPYRGLFAFREEDAPFFFGREAFIGPLVEAVRTQPLVAVLGPSGSGKSSLVFAGLMPELRVEGEWLVASFRPKERPLYELATVLIELWEPEESKARRDRDAEELALDLLGGKRQLRERVARILESHPNHRRLLLVVDQFEELYTLCRDSEEQKRFLDELLKAIQGDEPGQGSAGLTLVLTLRADFLGQALSYGPFADALQHADLKLRSMYREELQRAIEEPAERWGLRLEEGLTRRILDEVGGEPGNLPLLEFALTLLWQRQEEEQLTHRAYDEIGGVAAALAKHAEAVYSQLNETEQTQAQRIFLQLIRPGEGTEDTRRLATRSDVGEDNWELVAKLAGARLVVTGRNEASESETVEVVHEALIREWQRLRDWMRADRTFRTWQERLRAAMRQWETSSHDEGALLRGAPLAEATDWLEKRQGELSLTEREFIQVSLRLREQEEAARKRRQQWITRSLTGGLVGALVLVVFAGWQLHGAIISQSVTLSKSSELLLASDLNFDALLESLRAARKLKQAIWSDVSTRNQVRGTLQQAAYSSQERNRFQSHQDSVDSIEFSPNGQQLATLGEDGIARLWDLKGKQLAQFKPATGRVDSIEFSPNSQQLATGGEDGIARLWDLKGKQLAQFKPATGGVTSIEFSPNSQQLATGGADGTARLWDLKGKQLAQFKHSIDYITSIEFSPNSQQLATGGADGTARLWDLKGKQLAQFKHSIDYITSIEFSPNGQQLATLGSELDGTARLWDLKGKQLAQFKPTTGGVDSIDFSPNGQQLATRGSGLDGTARLWDLKGKQLAQFKHPTGSVDSIEFSPNGQQLATGGEDGTARLWDLKGKQLAQFKHATGSVDSIEFSPNGQQLATGGEDGTARLWDLKGKQLAQFKHATGSVDSIEFSPNGQQLATGGFDDGTARLWDLKGKQLAQFKHPTGGVTSIDFSPNGQQLATRGSGADGTARLWDLKGKQLAQFKHPTGGVTSIDFSPNGQQLATGGADGTARLWDLKGKQLTQFKHPTGHVTSIDFSPDGQQLATGGLDGTVRLWDLKGKQLAQFKHPTGGVYRIDFSPNGQQLATRGLDGTARLWDLKGKQLAQFKPATGGVTSIDFSPDGQQLATGGFDDGTARLWDLKGKQLA
ncbi:eIF2A-related protein, partial [Leptolyngbya sp. FACHB-261]|uniref:nSTAND1 domain-containing NTPase n=1 Tax=Leptolyngbya sp. FACHB-261 TaxID=2692806 RepID=UPI001683734B